MATSAAGSLLGQYESTQNSTGTNDKLATDKNTFLKLLVAQLTHQDPLNPVEDKEFIAQLAQFTQVEELQKLNTGMETLNESYLRTQVVNAASFIGTAISAKGDTVTLHDDYCSVIYPEFPRDVASGTVSVYATDSNGNIGTQVFSSALQATQAGTSRFAWDGLASSGAKCPNGTYVVVFSAKDYDGESMLVSAKSEGIVSLVETSADGNHYLYLEDGRKVRLNDVNMITKPTEQPPAPGEEDPDPTDPDPEDPDPTDPDPTP